jgi:(2S)-methylsuccinyl-CoA dehydrogenase
MLPEDNQRGSGVRLVCAARDATFVAESVLKDATAVVRERVSGTSNTVEREQRATHGLAWLATYVETIRQITAYAERIQAAGTLGEAEELLIRIGVGEYLAQIAGGIPMSQGEFTRPADLGLDAVAIMERAANPLKILVADSDDRRRLIELMRGNDNVIAGEYGFDESLSAIRDETRKFAESEVMPHAHAWHLANSTIPLDVVEQMATLGMFGLTVPETFKGGLGLGREATCVVAEELSRGYIGAGSLVTRSEIAAELILTSGTEEQKRRWLPGITVGQVLPTAVFTEPEAGSDLASLTTRAIRQGDIYRIYGNKTWITHAARADLMLLLVRSNPKDVSHRGLSMLLAEKPRGSDETPFPAKGMSGSEIEVLGYRGMKEYEIAFDGFEVPASDLLGGVEGLGFRQLMATFESSRIQTAARAVGVAQAAMEAAHLYAQTRRQFGQPILNFPRVADKIVMMTAEILMARQLTYFAARQKDAGRRCDLEAGMAKLLAARVAWAAADNAVQIHGGNGFALEFPASRLLCDARIFSIFEGTAEIQAQIIARRLLDA